MFHFMYSFRPPYKSRFECFPCVIMYTNALNITIRAKDDGLGHSYCQHTKYKKARVYVFMFNIKNIKEIREDKRTHPIATPIIFFYLT